MKKFKEKDFVKKLALIILIIFSFNIIIPTYSNAGIMGSLLSKPIASLVMVWLNTINMRLTVLFSPDNMIEDLRQGADGHLGIDNEEAVKNETDGDIVDKLINALDKSWDTLVYYIGAFCLSPDDIFSGEVQIADANVFSRDYEKNGDLNVTDLNLFNHLMKSLKETVAGLYYIMRNLAVVILLCLLIYSGIRIVLASNNSGEKAKWQMYLIDWVKALAIVMFVHIIMIAIFYVVDVVNEGLKNSIGNGTKIGTMIMNNFAKESIFDITGVWIYVIMYGYLTYMNIVFLIAYFKRLVYIMFMIVIAPITGALYPLGKKGHQIFSTWFNEFIAGVAIQPLHYLIYTILLATPLKLMQAAGTTGTWGNITPVSVQIYCLISIAMIRPIERYSRQIFSLGSTLLDNVASFESGNKTITSTVKAGVAVASLAAGVPQVGALLNNTIGSGEDNSIPDEEESGINYLTQGMQRAALPQKSSASMMGADNQEDDDSFSNFSPDTDPLGPTGGNGQNNLNTPNENTFGSEANDQLGNQSPAPLGPPDANTPDANTSTENTLGSDVTEEKQSETEDMASKIASEIKLDNANIQINNANEMNLDSVNALETNEMNLDSANILETNEAENEMQNVENNLSEPEKAVLGADKLSKLFAVDKGIFGLGEKIINKAARGDETFADRYKQVFKAPETQEKLIKAREAMHEAADSLYVPGQASGDWKNGVFELYNEQVIKPNKERIVNNFMSQENIDKAIKAYNLKDTKDDKGKVVKKKEDIAKEKLKDMAPYLYKGFNDVYQIKVLRDRGQTPDDAVRTAGREALAVNHFIKNKENRDTILQRAEHKIPKDATKAQVQQYIRQEVEVGKQYIASGYAKDVATVDRLVELERRIDKKIQLSGDSVTHKTDYVVRIDDAINKAIKDGVKNIKLPGANKDASIKTLQGVMNDVMKERRRAGGSPSGPAPTGPASGRTQPSRPAPGRTQPSGPAPIGPSSGRTQPSGPAPTRRGRPRNSSQNDGNQDGPN